MSINGRVRTAYLRAIFLLLVLSGASCTTAKIEDTTTKVDEVLFWAIVIEGQVIANSTFEGAMLTIENSGGVLQFSPIEVNANRGEVKVRIFSERKNKLLEEVVVPVNSSTTLSSRPEIEIVVGNIATLESPRQFLAAKNKCCVTCGVTTACNCGVTMTCGSCCSGDWCPDDDKLKLFFSSVVAR